MPSGAGIALLDPDRELRGDNKLGRLAILIMAGMMSISAAGQELDPKLHSARVSIADLELEISWKERGVWPDAVIHNVITAEVDATYVCLEGGQTKLADRQDVTASLTAEGDFNANKRGLSSGRLRLKPPGPGQFSCAPGQQLKLVCAAYRELNCRDDTFALSTQLRRTVVSFQPGYSEFCNLDLR